jgi:predicted methyltransferase
MPSAAASIAVVSAAAIRSFVRLEAVGRDLMRASIDPSDAVQSILRDPVPSLMSIKLFLSAVDTLREARSSGNFVLPGGNEEHQ